LPGDLLLEQIEDDDSLPVRLLRWVFSDSERRAPRHKASGLIAFYWTGGAPRSFPIATISKTGMYLMTKENWVTGTRIQMTLQMADTDAKDSSITVLTEVVSIGVDGLGFRFILSDSGDRVSSEFLPGEVTSRRALHRFLRRNKL
jgi:hypothetical protein